MSPLPAALRFPVAALVAAGVVLGIAPAAWAHAELLSSEPGYGDRLPTPPAQVRLDFSGTMDLTGARLTLTRAGGPQQALPAPTFATPDHRAVAVALPAGLTDGGYDLVWFFLGTDGHLMGGEVRFAVGAPVTAQAAVATAPPGAVSPTSRSAGGSQPVATRSLGPGIAGPALATEAAPVAPPVPARPRFRVAVAGPQAAVRFLDYSGLAVLVGGGLFLALLWTEGAADRRAQRILWLALGASMAATLLTFGLTAAGLAGVGATGALRPAVMGTVLGTRFARILAARGMFLGLCAMALALLTLGKERAARSRLWRVGAGGAAGGTLATHALLGHASTEGTLARAAVLVHLAGAAVWLGGLVFLAAVVLPRHRSGELRALLPRFSALAFTAVSVMVVAGAVMVTRVSPGLGQLPHSGYGRALILKLGLVVLLLAAAQQARTFTERRLVRDSTRLRPLLTAVGVELTLAVVILSSTAVLVGRTPPATRRPPPNAISTPTLPSPKGP